MGLLITFHSSLDIIIYVYIHIIYVLSTSMPKTVITMDQPSSSMLKLSTTPHLFSVSENTSDSYSLLLCAVCVSGQLQT